MPGNGKYEPVSRWVKVVRSVWRTASATDVQCRNGDLVFHQPHYKDKTFLQGRGRIDSSGSAGSETGSGVLEPPATPSAASVASIQAASTLYSTSIADRLILKGETATSE